MFLAEGFEETEALAPVDILRRGGVEAHTVSVAGCKTVTGSHGIPVVADMLLEDIGGFSPFDVLMLPGGLPGAENLKGHKALGEALVAHAGGGGRIAAICAAPMVLGSLGLLKGRKATCYPGFEGHLDGAEHTPRLIVEDGNILTGEGPGAAMPFGFKVMSWFKPLEEVRALERVMRFHSLLEQGESCQ